MTETSHLMPTRGLASDPVVYGVAQGLSQLFPPVEHPNGFSAERASAEPAIRQEIDGVVSEDSGGAQS